jgi:hypothetical protein
MPHVRLRPAPKPVELGPPIQLHGDHHAIRHALRTDVVVSHVGDVAQVGSHRKINTLRGVGAVKQLVPRGVDFLINGRFAHPEVLAKQVAVLARDISARRLDRGGRCSAGEDEGEGDQHCLRVDHASFEP